MTDLVKDIEFKVFSGPANAPGGRVAALCVPGGATISRSEIDAYTDYLRGLGAKGLAWIKVNEVAKGAEGLQSPIVKNLHAKALAAILERTGAKDGDIVFFGADKADACNAHLGALRQKVGHDRGLAEKGWRPLWVIDFPMFEFDEDAKEWRARHHPFTSPKDGHEAFIESDQAKAYAKAYDMVLNGWEVSGTMPFDLQTLRAAALGEMLRTIREEEPTRPSTRLSKLGDAARQIAEARRTDVKSLTKSLHQELGWIPLKAMRKDRAHRYRSAYEFADDIRNYLDGAALIAGPESAAYRVRKLVRKHRVPVIATAVVMGVILIGFVTSTSLYLRVRQARSEVVTLERTVEADRRLATAQRLSLKLFLGKALKPVDETALPQVHREQTRRAAHN